MLITLDDAGYEDNLLHFLREQGCLAYRRGAGSLTALGSGLAGREDDASVEALVERWRRLHPAAVVKVEPD